MHENPYVAPTAPIIVKEIDPRGIAERHRLLFKSLGCESALFLLLLMLGLIGRLFLGPPNLITGSLLPAFSFTSILILVSWATGVARHGTRHTTRGGWSGLHLVLLLLIPIYGLPAGWLMSRRATQYLRSKAYHVGRFGAELSRFDEQSS